MKKGRDEISKAIIKVLEVGPFSIQQISEKIHSNWSTVSEVLVDLRKNGKVKEIINTPKIKVYQLIITDTYFGIPLDESKKKLCEYIYGNVIKEFNTQENRFPNKTEIAKATVHVIDSLKLDIPTPWYLYGKVPLLIYEPAKEYVIEFSPKNSEAIITKVKEVVKDILKYHAQTKSIRKAQYLFYGEELYSLKEEIFNKLTQQKITNEQYLDLFNKFLLKCPTKHVKVFELTDSFLVTLNKFSLFADIKDYKKEIFGTFQNLWNAMAAFIMLDSLTEYKEYSNFNEIMKFYFERPIEIRMNIAEESISNIESIYSEKLKLKEELSPKTEELREILSDITAD